MRPRRNRGVSISEIVPFIFSRCMMIIVCFGDGIGYACPLSYTFILAAIVVLAYDPRSSATASLVSSSSPWKGWRTVNSHLYH